MLRALGKARGFRGKMGCAPWHSHCSLVVRNFSSQCFYACSGHLEFPVCVSDLVLSQVLPSHGHSTLQLGGAGFHQQHRVSSWAPPSVQSWDTLQLPQPCSSSLCCPWTQHPAGPGAPGSAQPQLLGSTATLLSAPLVQVGSACFSPWGQKPWPILQRVHRKHSVVLEHSPSGRDKTGLSKIPALQSPLSEQEGKLQASDYSGRRAHSSHLGNFFHHNQAFQEKGLKAWNSRPGIFLPGSLPDNTQEE